VVQEHRIIRDFLRPKKPGGGERLIRTLGRQWVSERGIDLCRERKIFHKARVDSIVVRGKAALSLLQSECAILGSNIFRKNLVRRGIMTIAD
jgi:hypothetical protein